MTNAHSVHPSKVQEKERTLSSTAATQRLAIDGGTAAVRDPLPPMYPGGMRIGEEEKQAVLRVLDSKRLFRYYGPTEGPSTVAEFEQAFAKLMGVAHAVAVSSGTTSLTGGLAALGVGPGDEVIVPAYTWIASAAAVTSMGAVPIVAEVDDTLTLDAADVEEKVTARTKAIIPVHMRGAPADMDALLAVAGRHEVRVLEDTAQAFGASYKGRRLGTIGDVGAFSLQFNKILTCGEGGVIATNDPRLYQRATMYHDVAASQRSGVEPEDAFVGITCRMSELQGAVAVAQLGRLQDILATMRARKAAIKSAIADVARDKGIRFRRLTDDAGDAAIALVLFANNAESAHHIATALSAEGAHASVLFDRDRSDYHVSYHWTPVLQKRSSAARTPWDLVAGEVKYDREMCPKTLALLERAVHLDVSPELTESQAEQVADALTKVLASLPDHE